MQCIVCDKRLGEKDILELKREGACFICLAFLYIKHYSRHWVCRRWLSRDIKKKHGVPMLDLVVGLSSVCFCCLSICFVNPIGLHLLSRVALPTLGCHVLAPTAYELDA